MRKSHDQDTPLELPKRLAQRATADTEPLGQQLPAQPDPRREGAGNDGARHLLEHAIGMRPVFRGDRQAEPTIGEDVIRLHAP